MPLPFQVILVVAFLKVAYGGFLEMISFCDCFIAYEGNYKDNVEKIGAVILNVACLFGVLSLGFASYVIAKAPMPNQGAMLSACTATITTGIITGVLTQMFTFHFKRIGEIGWKKTCGGCVSQMDVDGDGESFRAVSARGTFLIRAIGAPVCAQAWSAASSFRRAGRGSTTRRAKLTPR